MWDPRINKTLHYDRLDAFDGVSVAVVPDGAIGGGTDAVGVSCLCGPMSRAVSSVPSPEGLGTGGDESATSAPESLDESGVVQAAKLLAIPTRVDGSSPDPFARDLRFLLFLLGASPGLGTPLLPTPGGEMKEPSRSKTTPTNSPEAASTTGVSVGEEPGRPSASSWPLGSGDSEETGVGTDGVTSQGATPPATNGGVRGPDDTETTSGPPEAPAKIG